MSTNNKYEFDFEWALTKTRIQDLFNKNEKFIKSKVFDIQNFENVRFFFTLYLNGKEEDQSGTVWIYFNVMKLGFDKIDANLSFEVEKCKSEIKILQCSLSGSGGDGIELIKHKNLHMVKDSYVLKCHGILTIHGNNKSNLFNWVKNKNGRIDTCPHNFSSIYEAINKKQFMENKMFKDFKFEVVNAGFNFYYGNDVTGILDLDDLISLFHFAEKYDMKYLKAKVEYRLATKVSFKNVSQFFNFSEKFNAEKLKNICEAKFAMKSFINGIGNPSCNKKISYKLNLHKDGYVKTIVPKFEYSNFDLLFDKFMQIYCCFLFVLVLYFYFFGKPVHQKECKC